MQNVPRAALGLIVLMLGACTTTVTRERGVLFDDFSYATQEQFAANRWIVRTAKGWPGVPDASWGSATVSFVNDPARGGNRLLRLTAWMGGGGATHQAQVCHQRKYLDGTFAARVRFSDQPASGPDGDQVVQTFYLISPIKEPMHPDYSETDFEYLPNGGWGKSGPRMYATTWETFRLEPWHADNASTDREQSMNGWRTLVLQIGGGKVRYFLDGVEFATHGDRYYPEVMMSINFNLWFIRGGVLQSAAERRWVEDVDWVFFEDGTPLSPAEVGARVDEFRARNVAFRDTVPQSGLESPCNF